MRNTWLVLMALVAQALALQVLALQPLAAEKTREWQTGQVVESKAALGPQVHTVAAGAKHYLVRGSLGDSDRDLNVGDNVRFAVEGKSVFVSIAGKEYKLYLLGETVAAPPSVDAPPVPQVPAQPVTPRPAAVTSKPAVTVQQPVVTAPAVTPPPPAATRSRGEAVAALDNDAVVKMVVGGLREGTVVTVVESKPGNYTLTRDAVAGLKAAGVPQSVISAMSAKMKDSH